MPNEGGNKSGRKHSTKKNGKNKSKKSVSENNPNESAGSSANFVRIPTELSSSTVKCMWEQHDTTEIDIHSEVYSKLAEDATYKLWELINNIKTSARHSGGKISQDLVNDVLKDADVAPIIGSYDALWEKIDYDGAYFYNADEILDLREEYLKATTIKPCNPVCFDVSWMSDSDIFDDLKEFLTCLRSGAFLEEDEDFDLIMSTVSTNCYIPSAVRAFLDRCIEVLAFEYTPDLLDRNLKFLNAIMRNPYIRDTDVSEELELLSQLFACLLLGSNLPECNIKEEIEEEEENIVPIANNFDNINQIDKIENLSSVFEINPSTDLEMPTEFMEIKREECEALLMNNEIKEEIFSIEDNQILLSEQDINIKSEFMDNFDDYNTYNTDNNYNMDNNNYSNTEEVKNAEIFDNPSLNISETTSIDENNGATEKPHIYTKMCDNYAVNDVSHTVGLMCNKWGYFERNVTYLLVERLEQYFSDKDNDYDDDDYQFICRASISLWCIGELAFRELAEYFCKIDTNDCPEYFQYYFNRTALFLRGRRDLEIYNWLRDVCGDTMMPFMLHYTRKIEKMNKKYAAMAKIINSRESIFKILPKVLLQTAPINTSIRNRMDLSYTDYFEDHVKVITKDMKSKFTFRRPVILKPKKPKPIIPPIQQYSQNIELLSKFNQKVVIAKRKILKPLTNQYIHKPFKSLAFIQL